jgi:hypothetical protein
MMYCRSRLDRREEAPVKRRKDVELRTAAAIRIPLKMFQHPELTNEDE